ncbi:hypothetical protein SAMN06296241_3137 [Salinimicrobium sediminis]|uniref:Uncharacterized protein n=1 Tax=Salinimicrobium sediminis TaxID=1343891 RepID=A0A285X8D6_9FLAO|nr:hypothetical protein [Salinimicrobium sediminis]SOC81558.1 hypothetical protein SAMN06296241_3137 [Salinimicrobium sediminis]
MKIQKMMYKNNLREDMAKLFKADPEIEVLQVNFIVRKIHERPQNFSLLTYNYTT